MLAPGAGAIVTLAIAEQHLKNRIAKDQAQIMKALKTTISQKAIAALLSFNYNLGFGNTAKLISDINKGNTMNEVAARLQTFVYAGGKKLDGLVTRRNEEAKLMIA